jgi:hypothetical protein
VSKSPFGLTLRGGALGVSRISRSGRPAREIVDPPAWKLPTSRTIMPPLVEHAARTQADTTAGSKHLVRIAVSPEELMRRC